MLQMSSKKISKIEKQRSHILSSFQEISQMIRGTYVETHRKCGKVNCWCAKDSKGHPSCQISWSKDGKSRSKAIPKEDTTWIKEMTKNYQKWRSLRANLRKIEKELLEIIDKREYQVIKRTEKLKRYF